MVKVRLQRIGARNQPKFRIVVANKTSKQSGKVLEVVGSYDPTIENNNLQMSLPRYEYWVSVGAVPTKSVSDLVRAYERTSRVPG